MPHEHIYTACILFYNIKIQSSLFIIPWFWFFLWERSELSCLRPTSSSLKWTVFISLTYIGLFFLFVTVLQLSLSLKLCWSQNVKFNISHIFIQSRRVKKEITTELEVPKTTLRPPSVSVICLWSHKVSIQ